MCEAEVPDESSVKVGETQDPMECLAKVGDGPFGDSINLCRIHLDTVGGDDVTKERS